MVNPTVVVEVLSPATIDYDLGEKFEHYRQIPSLKAVVYIWQDRKQIEIRERTANGDWRSNIGGVGNTLAIEALGSPSTSTRSTPAPARSSRPGRNRRARQRDVAAVDEAPFHG